LIELQIDLLEFQVLLTENQQYMTENQIVMAGKEADAILAQWRKAEAEHAGDPGAMAAFCNQQSLKLIETIKSLPGMSTCPVPNSIAWGERKEGSMTLMLPLV
jgi:hypothetical protein